MINQLFELYARCGKSLDNNGIKGAVLPISELDYVLELFQKSHLVILGGDLYEESSLNNFEYIYASWSYDGNTAQDSINETRIYLEQFTEQDLFVLFVIKTI